MNSIAEISLSEKLNWLRLIRSENVGPITFFQLLKRYGTATQALAELPELAKKGGAKRPIQIFAKASAQREMDQLLEFGGQLIAACEPQYPPLLRQIHDPPPVISALGHVSLLQKECIGIVGSRNASAVALKLTQKFSSDLGQKKIVIVSGLARGIDSAAHNASLETGTIGVVGGGVDIAYPRENRDLQNLIAERGCVIAEQSFGTQPQARHFPRRNRIISGLSLGVLVMEATPKSGSLITARMAAEQGREVFAVPGSPMDPRAKGANNLIRNGAALVESASEILEELQPARSRPLQEPDQPMLPLSNTPPLDTDLINEARPYILSLLSPVAVNIDELVRLSSTPPSIVLTILLELELAGRIERHFGNRVSLTG